MDEAIERLLKEIEALDPSEKEKYIIKQQEAFLKSIDSRKLIERIRKFRLLNIKDMKIREVWESISEVLTWNGAFFNIANMRTYPTGTPFFRIKN